MNRREAIAAIGVPVALWTTRGFTQPAREWRVGFLHPGQSIVVIMRVAALREGLGKPDSGGSSVVLEGIAEERVSELPAIAARLLQDGAQALCAISPSGVRAALAVSSTVPIVAVDLESDPIGNGWAASLARPGGNISGIFLDLPDFTAKCVQLLREALPGMKNLALLWHPASGSMQLNAAQRIARTYGLSVEVFEASSIAEFEPAFRAMVAGGTDGALMLSSPVFGGNSKLMAALASANRVPAINQFPDFAEQGGLLAFGPDLQDLYRQAGVMLRRVFLGTPIADLPIDRPSRFKLVINLQTALSLGIPISPSLLARADQVIE